MALLQLVILGLCLVSGCVSVVFDFKPVKQEYQCRSNTTWILKGQITLDNDVTLQPQLVVYALTELCKVDLTSCYSSQSYLDVCSCKKQCHNCYNIQIGTRNVEEHSGKIVQLSIQGNDVSKQPAAVSIVGRIPTVYETMEKVNLIYRLNNGPVNALLSKQTLTVCPKTWTSIKVCAANKRPQSLLKITDSEQEISAISSCVVTWKNDFTTASVHGLTVFFQERPECPITDQFKIYIKEKSEGCPGFSLDGNITSVPTTSQVGTSPQTTLNPTTEEQTTPQNVLECGQVLSNGLTVLCDTDTDGDNWYIIQKRVSQDTYFYQNWQKYETGFGDSSTNFWLGLQHIYRMCNEGTPCRLRIDMSYKGEPYKSWATKTSDGKYRDQYEEFYLAGPDDFYRLKISGHSGTAGFDLSYDNNQRFSTKDKDNDKSDERHCAQLHRSGWWFHDCTYANLNGVMRNPGSQDYSDLTSANWWSLTSRKSLQRIEMKIKIL